MTNTSNTISTYQQQAIDFLKKANATMTIVYSHTGKHFGDDKEVRDIYEITIDKGRRSYTFNFGASINDSRYTIVAREFNRIELKDCLLDNGKINPFKFKYKYYDLTPAEVAAIKYPSAPSEYDVLSCLTKTDPGTFGDFCSEFGYDTDSRFAESIYQSVMEEYRNLAMLFTESELEEMQEIQ